MDQFNLSAARTLLSIIGFYLFSYPGAISHSLCVDKEWREKKTVFNCHTSVLVGSKWKKYNGWLEYVTHCMANEWFPSCLGHSVEAGIAKKKFA